MGMISAMAYGDGGPWVQGARFGPSAPDARRPSHSRPSPPPATVLQHEYRQDNWCEGFVCAYLVQVDGDDLASPVREDHEQCIRGVN